MKQVKHDTLTDEKALKTSTKTCGGKEEEGKRRKYKVD